MKKHLSVLLPLAAFLLPLSLRAQSFVWPMAGKSAGQNTLCQPQGYIGDEHNFSCLFIGGDEGDVVVCPADGTIQRLSLQYLVRLDYSLGYGLDPGKSFDEGLAATDFGSKVDPKYASGSVSILLPDGRHLHLSGLRGDRRFKTGQAIAAGDTLGVLAYSYKGFPGPSLNVSLSDAQTRVADPMAPFGLKSTFVAPQSLKRDNPMAAEKIQADLDVLAEAVCELYPSLEDRMPETAFRAYMDSLKATVTAPMDPGQPFRRMLNQVVGTLADSHISLRPDPIPSQMTVRFPGAYLMYCADTLRILIAGSPQYAKYEGKPIARINGMSGSEFAAVAAPLVLGYDGQVQSLIDEELVMLGAYALKINWLQNASAYDIEFTDGSSVSIPFTDRGAFPPNDMYLRVSRWRMRNVQLDDSVPPYETRVLNDSTAYLGIRHFDLLEAHVEAIRAFLGACTQPNLIVDMRNNPGGNVAVLARLLACLADAPMDRQRGGYGQVNSPGPYASFQYCMNRPPEDVPFPEFTQSEDGRWISRDTLNTCSCISPDPECHYGGKVYVLTNGYSFSAATIFPAVLVRNRRGVSVGRETGSTYHSMTALRFADICLPNTLQTITLPLVKEVFDETMCERLPKGRGLLPDYPLPLSYDEVTMGADGQTDVLLEYALSLIAEGRYLSEEDPFAAAEPAPADGFPKILVIALAALLLVAAAFLLTPGKRK